MRSAAHRGTHYGAPVTTRGTSNAQYPGTLVSRAGEFVLRRVALLDVMLRNPTLVSLIDRTRGSHRPRLAHLTSGLDVAAELASLDGTAYRDQIEGADAPDPYEALSAGAWRRRRAAHPAAR